jgi:hypothetical protein
MFPHGRATRVLRFAAICRASAARPQPNDDLADAAETRVPRGYGFRFVGALERGAYHPQLKTFARSQMKSGAAISRHDLPDLDGV